MTNERFTDLIITDPESGALRFRSYTFQVVDGPDRGRSVTSDRGSVIVGSAPDADLALTDTAVSRAHVRLVPFGDGVEITDLDSKNGVYLAGTRLMHARVAPGTEFTIGRSTIRILPSDRDAAIEPSERTEFGGLHGKSRAMRQLFSVLELAAKGASPVLIEGENGVGKMRAARSIHQASSCAADPFTIIHARDATSQGWEEALTAGPGTVCLNEVDLLPGAGQIDLLRALESGAVSKRLVSTTEKNLRQASSKGGFDKNLLLRIAVLHLRVPPLRERGSDLPLLIADVLAELGHPTFEIGPSDLGRMQAYAWPDNVAELRMVIERAVSLQSVSLSDQAPDDGAARSPKDAVVGADLPYKQARAQMIEAFEREYVRGLLEHHGGNISKAARAAGIDRVYLHRLLKKYEL